VLDVREMLRRLQLGQGDRAIARDLSLSRKTVTKYRQWAATAGLLTGPLPEPAALQALLATSGALRAGQPMGTPRATVHCGQGPVGPAAWAGDTTAVDPTLSEILRFAREESRYAC
jgi:hypothetical protein